MKLYDELGEKEKDVVDMMLRQGGCLAGVYHNIDVDDFLCNHFPGLKHSTAIAKFRKILIDLEKHSVLRSSWRGITYLEAGDISLAKRSKHYQLKDSFVNMSGLDK